MIKFQVVKKVETGTSWDLKDNPELRKIIELVLGESLENYFHRVLVKVCQAIKENTVKVDDFVVRVFAGNSKEAWSCKRDRNVTREKNDTLPDMIISFANDIVEFEKSVIHETLHCLRWDEDMVERKTQELYKDFHR